MAQKLLWLALAGGLGTIARYGLAEFIEKTNTATFPLGTLAVNVIGCFLAGLLWTLFEGRWPVPPQAKILVLVGFMGAFTTFSAFIVEAGELLRAAEWFRATGSILLQNGLGFVALFAGVSIGRIL